jgi:hypothetical protein
MTKPGPNTAIELTETHDLDDFRRPMGEIPDRVQTALDRGARNMDTSCFDDPNRLLEITDGGGRPGRRRGTAAQRPTRRCLPHRDARRVITDVGLVVFLARLHQRAVPTLASRGSSRVIAVGGSPSPRLHP